MSFKNYEEFCNQMDNTIKLGYPLLLDKQLALINKCSDKSILLDYFKVRCLLQHVHKYNNTKTHVSFNYIFEKIKSDLVDEDYKSIWTNIILYTSYKKLYATGNVVKSLDLKYKENKLFIIKLMHDNNHYDFKNSLYDKKLFSIKDYPILIKNKQYDSLYEKITLPKKQNKSIDDIIINYFNQEENNNKLDDFMKNFINKLLKDLALDLTRVLSIIELQKNDSNCKNDLFNQLSNYHLFNKLYNKDIKKKIKI